MSELKTSNAADRTWTDGSGGIFAIRPLVFSPKEELLLKARIAEKKEILEDIRRYYGEVV